MLANAGTSRHECYITNVCQERPPNNNFDFFYEDGKKRLKATRQLIDARNRLWKELEQIKPGVVVPMGKEAVKALMLEDGIKKWRGLPYDKFGYRFIATYHPAYLLRGQYFLRPVVELDLKKAYRHAITDHPTPKPILRYDPSFHEAMDFLHSRPKRVSVDTETFYPHIRCMGFGISESEAICIPFIRAGTSRWTPSEEVEILQALDRFLRDDTIEKVLQNSPFDLTAIGRTMHLQINGLVMDTMYAHHLLYPEWEKSLDFLTSIRTDHPLYWAHKDTTEKENQKYCCMDCIVTLDVANQTEEELKERGMWEFYQKEIHPAIFGLTRMQNRGVKIDTKARQVIDDTVDREMNEILQKIQTITGGEFNPSSPKQVQDLVYKRFGLPVQRKPKTKAVTTDGEALRILARRYPMHADILESIITYREKRTLLSTFVRSRLAPGDRIKTSYNLAGQVTGRISSSETIDGYGGNLTNIPRTEFRRIFIPDEGKILIKVDLAQAEYRVLIWKARIRRIIDQFLHNPQFSIHRWNAVNIFGVALEDITKQQYGDAKNGVYGANYGIGPLKASRMYTMEFQRAKFIIDRYHQHVPEVQEVYQREIREQLMATRTITNACGRERMFFDRMDEDLFRKAYAHYCQSTVADLILQAIVELDQQDEVVILLMQVHDELVAQCDEDQKDIACAMVKKALERPLYFDGVDEPLIIPAEVQVGPNWYDVEEWTPQTSTS